MAWNRPDGSSGAPSVFIRVHPWFHNLLRPQISAYRTKPWAALLVHPIALWPWVTLLDTNP
jgi:hypothetical protein